MIKKLLFIVMTFVISSFFPSERLFAIQSMVGAKVWYANWYPYLKDTGINDEVKYMGWQALEKGGGWMYGASGSINLTDKINFSASFLLGSLMSQFENDGSRYTDRDNNSLYSHEKYYQVGKATIARQDLDVALSYTIGTSFKIFGGYKYQPLKMDVIQDGADWSEAQGGGEGSGVYNQGTYNKTKFTFEQINHAPALGVGYSYSFAERFAFAANVSLLYLTGSVDIKMDRKEYNVTTWSDQPSSRILQKYTMDFTGFGINAEPSIVAAVSESIIAIIGFRYQLLIINADLSQQGYSETESIDSMKDHVFGVYASVMYCFR